MTEVNLERSWHRETDHMASIYSFFPVLSYFQIAAQPEQRMKEPSEVDLFSERIEETPSISRATNIELEGIRKEICGEGSRQTILSHL